MVGGTHDGLSRVPPALFDALVSRVNSAVSEVPHARLRHVRVRHVRVPHVRVHGVGLPHVWRVAVALVVSTLILAGCGDDQANSTPPSSAATSDAAASADVDTDAAQGTQPGVMQPVMPVGSIRGERYCEFLLITPTGAGLVAEVYATFPLNNCPADIWDAADTSEVAASAGVPLAMANGPRYWLIDTVSRVTTDDIVRRDLGGLAMNRYATVEIADFQLAEQRYTAQSVDRQAIMTFFAGSEIYVLVAPDGNQYVMQSFSQQVDAGLTEADLAALGDRLNLPTGWRYEVRVLTEDLVIDFGGQPARVLQDELQNSYSQIPPTG